MASRSPLRVPTRPTLDEAVSSDLPEESGVRLSPGGFFVGGIVGGWMIEGLIGRGGMAEVWRAHGVKSGEPVAVKRILPRLAQNHLVLAMFLDEARMGMRLSHPNVVRAIEIGEHGGEPYLVTELVQGPSCATLLRTALARQERISPSAALYTVIQLLDALDYVHQLPDEDGRPLNVVHRDVSPGNVLLATPGVVKLADFGIIHLPQGEPRALPGTLQGKRGYMAPEQLAGSGIDSRTDLFSAGIVLSELLTGQPLFYQPSELEFLLDNYRVDTGKLDRVPRRVRCVLERVLMRCSADRHLTAREFSNDLIRAAALDGIEPSGAALDRALARLELNVAGAEIDRETSRRPVRGRISSASLRASLPERPPPSLTSSPRWTSSRSTLIASAMRAIATGKPTRELPALAESGLVRHYAELPAYRFGQAPCTAWRVSFSRGGLPALMFGLLRRRSTGLCVFRRSGIEKRIYLDHGLPIFIASTDPEELLGSRLIRSGNVTHEQVEHCIEHAIRNGGRIGEALVDVARVRPVVVLRELMAQMSERFTELGFWPDGELSFSPGERPGMVALRPHQAPESLVVRVIRRGYGEAELASLLAPIAVEPLTFDREAYHPDRLDLSPPERLVLENIGFRERIATIQLKLGADVSRAHILRAIFIGLSVDAIRPTRECVAA